MCQQTVEKMDLIGLDFLWKICMNVPDFSIAESAISLLLNVSYINLAGRYKRVSVVLLPFVKFIYIISFCNIFSSIFV